MKKVGTVVLGKSFFSSMLSNCNDYDLRKAEFAIVQDGEDFKLLSKIERTEKGVAIVADFSRCAEDAEPEPPSTPDEKPVEPESKANEVPDAISEPVVEEDAEPGPPQAKPKVAKEPKKAAPAVNG